jgi:histidinol-phosphate aminotransferase
MKTAARFDSFPPYTPIEPFEVLSARLNRPPETIVKCDANENPYGPSPKARRALAELPYAHIYPDPESRALRAALADYTGLPVESLLAGAGADELIDLLLRVLLEPGDRVINCPPTFGMYPFDTRLNAGQLIDVPRRPDFSLDLPALAAAVAEHQPKALFLANPNNPDGSLIDPAELDALLALPVLVVLDEAYIEFTDAGGRLGEGLTRLAEVPQRENLVVLRTFSKWAGLAGLRVGYGAFPGWLLPALWRAKQPYNVNVAASAAAIASLDDLDWLAGNVARIKAERERLFARLAAIPGIRPLPSQANFILCQVEGKDAALLKAELLAQGVLLRYYDTPALRGMLRVTIGTPRQSDAVVAALRYALGAPPETSDGSSTDDVLPLSLEPDAVNPASPTLRDLPDPVSDLATRKVTISRVTRETNIALTLDLDGTGAHRLATGLPFLDHMLAQLAVHGLLDLDLTAQGDLHIDPHHTIEDTALALGQAFRQVLGDRAGIVRMASASVPMDDALANVALDLSGRPYARIDVPLTAPALGGIPNSLWAHFWESFAGECRCNLHIAVPYARDDHHAVEAVFKALARVLAAATRLDPRRAGQIPSSKGV